MEEVEDFELEQEVDGVLPETQEVEYHDLDDMPSAVDDAAEVMSNPQADMIDQILDGDLTNAEGSFKDILDTKLNDAMDNKKVEIANSVYNNIDDMAEPTYTPTEDELSAESDDVSEVETPGEEIQDETTDSIEQ
jgi:hypothetical protein